MAKLLTVYLKPEDAELVKRAKVKAAAERRSLSAAVLTLLEAWVEEKAPAAEGIDLDVDDLPVVIDDSL